MFYSSVLRGSTTDTSVVTTGNMPEGRTAGVSPRRVHRVYAMVYLRTRRCLLPRTMSLERITSELFTNVTSKAMGKAALNPTMTVLYEAKVTLDFS